MSNSSLHSALGLSMISRLASSESQEEFIIAKHVHLGSMRKHHRTYANVHSSTIRYLLPLMPPLRTYGAL